MSEDMKRLLDVEPDSEIIIDNKRFVAPDKQKHSKRIYLGSKSRPWGLHPTDIFNLDYYLAATILNGLRMIMSEGHHYYDEEMELVAAKIEFYLMDLHSVIDENIDFSSDREIDWESFPDSISFEGRPGWEESYKKFLVVNEVQGIYMKQAMQWLADNWGSLWD